MGLIAELLAESSLRRVPVRCERYGLKQDPSGETTPAPKDHRSGLLMLWSMISTSCR